MVTVFSDSNSSTSHPSLQSDSQGASFHLGFPAQFPDFHFHQFRPLPLNLKCAAPVDPGRDFVDFEFRKRGTRLRGILKQRRPDIKSSNRG